MITQFLKRRVASETGVIRFVQASCHVAAALIPVLAFPNFADWELAEAHLLVGVMATLSMAVFYAALSVMLEFKTKAAQQ
jgi:hypothetical protein